MLDLRFSTTPFSSKSDHYFAIKHPFFELVHFQKIRVLENAIYDFFMVFLICHSIMYSMDFHDFGVAEKPNHPNQ